MSKIQRFELSKRLLSKVFNASSTPAQKGFVGLLFQQVCVMLSKVNVYSSDKWCVTSLWLQVALGDCNELLDANYEANNLPDGKHSTKGLGQTGPDPRNSITLLVSLITQMYFIQARHWFNCDLLHNNVITLSESGCFLDREQWVHQNKIYSSKH